MAHLSLNTRENMRKKRMAALFTYWTHITNVCVWFFELVHNILKENYMIMSLQTQLYVLNFSRNRQIVHRLVYESDATSLDNLRMTRHAFTKLCTMLQTIGGLRGLNYLCVDEQVVMFLHILTHHVKNRVIKFRFLRFEQTASRYFHNILHSIIYLHRELLKRPEPVHANSIDERWKWFKNCLGALYGTYISVRVPVFDKPRSRNRKGHIATNVLGVCSQDMQFIYVLPGWKGSTANSRLLRDALRRRNGLNVPNGYYYLVDAGYTNCNGFLVPYCGQRYHLSEWAHGRQHNTHEEFFNMKYSAAQNVIEWCFGVLKNRWAILRSPSFYPIKTQNRIILVCCLLHNFIRREMRNDPYDNVVDEPVEEFNQAEEYSSSISTIEPTDE
ncbi:hypothetical protein UlMin_043406 [Ulmus minor]